MIVRKRNKKILAIFILSDLFFTAASFLLAYYIRFRVSLFHAPKGIPPFKQYFELVPLILAIWLLTYAIQGLYRSRRGKSFVDEFFSVMLGSVLATFILLSILLFYRVYYQFDPAISSRYEYSRLAIAIFIFLNVALVFTSRYGIRKILQHYRRKGYNQIRILIAGAGELGRKIADKISERTEFGFEITGFLDDDPKKKKLIYDDIPVLGTLDDFCEVAEQREINSLFVALPLYAHKKMLKLVHEANTEGIDIKLFPDIMQYLTLKAELRDLDGLPVINLNRPPLAGINAVIKRVVDTIFSAFFLLFFTIIPIIPIIIIAIKLTSRGPVFYTQERMGMDGKLFKVIKFRSMVQNAESGTGPVFADENDPRTTKIGRFLRFYNLDEIPQFINVIKGNMSIVGPRPERPSFVKQFKKEVPKYMLRHKVKSGITGWAQINGWRGKTSIKARIEHDLYYIENWSLLFDIKIMWHTFIHWILRRPVVKPVNSNNK